MHGDNIYLKKFRKNGFIPRPIMKFFRSDTSRI